MIKDVPGGFPKSDLLGVTVALIHVVGQQFLAVLCQLQRQFALLLRNKSVISHLWLKIAQTPWHILKTGGAYISDHELSMNLELPYI